MRVKNLYSVDVMSEPQLVADAGSASCLSPCLPRGVVVLARLQDFIMARRRLAPSTSLPLNHNHTFIPITTNCSVISLNSPCDNRWRWRYR